VAGQGAYASTLDNLRERLRAWMKETGDPRALNEHDDRWDRYPYYGGQPGAPGKKQAEAKKRGED